MCSSASWRVSLSCRCMLRCGPNSSTRENSFVLPPPSLKISFIHHSLNKSRRCSFSLYIRKLHYAKKMFPFLSQIVNTGSLLISANLLIFWVYLNSQAPDQQCAAIGHVFRLSRPRFPFHDSCQNSEKISCQIIFSLDCNFHVEN